MALTLTPLDDILLVPTVASPPLLGDYQTYGWWPEVGIVVGDLGYFGYENPQGDKEARGLQWVPGNNGVAGVVIATPPAKRRWYLEGTDPGLLLVGWTDELIVDTGPAPFVMLMPQTIIGEGDVLDGEAVATGDGIVYSHTPVVLAPDEGVAVATGDGDIVVSLPVTLVPTEGQAVATGDGELMVAGLLLPQAGEAVATGEMTGALELQIFPEGPGGIAELELTPLAYPGAARIITPPAYFERMNNRRYGGTRYAMGKPFYADEPANPTWAYAASVIFLSWCNDGRGPVLTDVSGNDLHGQIINLVDAYAVAVSGAGGGLDQTYYPVGVTRNSLTYEYVSADGDYRMIWYADATTGLMRWGLLPLRGDPQADVAYQGTNATYPWDATWGGATVTENLGIVTVADADDDAYNQTYNSVTPLAGGAVLYLSEDGLYYLGYYIGSDLQPQRRGWGVIAVSSDPLWAGQDMYLWQAPDSGFPWLATWDVTVTDGGGGTAVVADSPDYRQNQVYTAYDTHNGETWYRSNDGYWDLVLVAVSGVGVDYRWSLLAASADPEGVASAAPLYRKSRDTAVEPWLADWTGPTVAQGDSLGTAWQHDGAKEFLGFNGYGFVQLPSSALLNLSGTGPYYAAAVSGITGIYAALYNGTWLLQLGYQTPQGAYTRAPRQLGMKYYDEVNPFSGIGPGWGIYLADPPDVEYKQLWYTTDEPTAEFPWEATWNGGVTVAQGALQPATGQTEGWTISVEAWVDDLDQAAHTLLCQLQAGASGIFGTALWRTVAITLEDTDAVSGYTQRYPATVTDPTDMVAGAWVRWTLVWDLGNLVLYRDREAVATAVCTATGGTIQVAAAASVLIGAVMDLGSLPNESTPDNRWEGRVSEVIILDKAMPA
ncbi:MAG TPA: LamG-like jellyroll fold domain-containing protein, partial [Anaerolineae bacterium]|nr:LamG-like jellyroll fold domain-containing protein [Anaerolineae bacterium]